jgi:hypothetical protein
MPMTDTSKAQIVDPRPAVRMNIDSDDVARGFGQVVVAVAEILRELLERQAIRRMDAGDLDDAQIERLGTSLLRISEQLEEVRVALTKPRTQSTRRDSE